MIDSRIIWKRGFELAARSRSPRLAAWLLYLTSKTKKSTTSRPKSTTQRPRMLALSVNKSGFLQDVEESFLKTDEFDLVFWPVFALRIFADTILSPSLHDNQRYLTDNPAVEATKQDYRDFLKQTWRHLSKKMPIHVVLSPNYGYYTQREFAAALEEIGTPFIVIHKENLKSPGRLDYWQAVYEEHRGRFYGRKILVYNDIEKDLQVRTGVAETEKVIITGMPRLDRIHEWRRQQAAKERVSTQPQVLFFAFDKMDKLPTARGTQIVGVSKHRSDLSWSLLCEKTHSAVADLARQRTDIKVVVKTKAIARQQEDVLKMLSNGDEPLPPNLEIVTGGDPFRLLTESHVVIGFNTTAQLEAMAAGLPVIVPWFDEATGSETSDFVIDLGDSVEYATSPDQIITLVCNHIDRPGSVKSALPPSVRHALRQWTGNDDGQAKRRVLDAVNCELGHPAAPVSQIS